MYSFLAPLPPSSPPPVVFFPFPIRPSRAPLVPPRVLYFHPRFFYVFHPRFLLRPLRSILFTCNYPFTVLSPNCPFLILSNDPFRFIFLIYSNLFCTNLHRLLPLVSFLRFVFSVCTRTRSSSFSIISVFPLLYPLDEFLSFFPHMPSLYTQTHVRSELHHFCTASSASGFF